MKGIQISFSLASVIISSLSFSFFNPISTIPCNPQPFAMWTVCYVQCLSALFPDLPSHQNPFPLYFFIYSLIQFFVYVYTCPRANKALLKNQVLYKPYVTENQHPWLHDPHGVASSQQNLFFKYKFTANNYEALLQTAQSVWPTLCSWPYGLSSLGLCMFFFQLPTLWNVSTVFKVSHSCMKTYQALAGEKLASLHGLLCRGVKYFTICKWDELSSFGDLCRWLNLSPCFDIAEAVSIGKVLVKLYKSSWVQRVLQLIMLPKFWHT